MRLHFLFAMVGIQILVFQFLSVRFLRAIPGYVLGDLQLSEDVREAVDLYKTSVRRWTYPIGGILLVALALFVYVIPPTDGVAVAAAIAAVSILSSGCFVWTYLRARSAANRITEKLPDSGVRVASLERRTLGHYYNVAWELVPFAILAASAAMTFWAFPKLGQPYPLHFGQDEIPDSWGEGTGRFLAILALQGTCAFGMLLLTFRVLRSRACFSPKAPVATQQREQAGRIGEGIRRRELRFFMAAKVGVALQFGLTLFVKIETATGARLPLWAESSPWGMTGFLLILFLVYIVQAAREQG